MAENATKSGRHSNTATDVTGIADDGSSVRNDGSLATGRTARDTRKVVGIVGSTEDHVVRIEPETIFGNIRHSDRDAATDVFQVRSHLSVDRGTNELSTIHS